MELKEAMQVIGARIGFRDPKDSACDSSDARGMNG